MSKEEFLEMEEVLNNTEPTMEEYATKKNEDIPKATMSLYDEVLYSIRRLSLDEQSQIIHSILHERATELSSMRDRNFGFLNHIGL